MEKNELRTFAFKTKEEALAAVDCTEQPESLTSLVCHYVEDELGGKMKGFSLSWL